MLVFADNFGLMSPYTAGQQDTYSDAQSVMNSVNQPVGGARPHRSGGVPGYIFYGAINEDDFPSPNNNTGVVHDFDHSYDFFAKGFGRMSENAIVVRYKGEQYSPTTMWWGASPVIPKTKRVVVGMWIGPVAPGFANLCRPQADLLHVINSNSSSDPLRTNNTFLFMFSSLTLGDRQSNGDFYDSSYLHNVNYSGASSPFRHMTVKCILTGGDCWTVQVVNHSGTAYVYNTVPISVAKYADATRPFFLEVLIDANEAVIGKGFVKVAVNGVEIARIDNLYTLDVQRLGGDMLSPNAYYQRVVFGMTPSINVGHGWQVDGYYICDESAGYQNDFLGPVNIVNVFPADAPEVGEWTTVLDGAHGEFDAEDCVSLDYYCRSKFSETTYIEADQHKMRELFRYNFPFDVRRTDIKAVQLNTAFEKQRTFTNAAAPSRAYATVQISGHAPEDANSYTFFSAEEVHRCLPTPLSIAPTLATPWTWDLLQNATFGFTYYDGEYEDITCNIVSVAGYVHTLGGMELFDGNPATSITSSGDPSNCIVKIPDGKIVCNVEVSCGQSTPGSIRGHFYVSCDNGNTWITLYPYEFALAGASYGIAPPAAYVAKYRIDLPVPITHINVSAYGSQSYWRDTYYSMRVTGAKKA